MREILAASIMCFSCDALLAQAIDDRDLQDMVERSLRQAVVKIDVSSNVTVIRNNINICRNEGTGFLVTSRHIVTAKHVIELAADCGKPVIVLKSESPRMQRIAEQLAAKDDVAILQIEQAVDPQMCTLGIGAFDVYGVRAIRFGIPGGFEDPPPAFGVKIGERSTQFEPLVLMAPMSTEHGESGGPVIYRMNVVGITHAKHKRYNAYSFMIVGAPLRALLREIGLQQSDEHCAVRSSVGVREATLAMKGEGKVIGRVDGRIVGHLDPEDLAQLASPQRSGTKIKVRVGDDKESIEIERPFNRPLEHARATAEVGAIVQKIRQRSEELMWRQYEVAAERTGKWKATEVGPSTTVPHDPLHMRLP